MKIRKSDFTGTGKVYGFTLAQMLKGKANIITMILLFLALAAGIPVMTVFMGGGEEPISSDITAVYVRNDTGYVLELESIPAENEIFADTEFIDTDWSEETYGSQISSSEAYVHLQKDTEEKCFAIKAYTLEEKEFQDGDLDACISTLSGLLDRARYAQQNARPEQVAILTSSYDTNVQGVSEYLEAKEENFDARFGVQMLYSMLLLILCTFVSSFIIQKVIEEKASKLAELLMVSIQPLAMLLGKILAVMTYIFGMAAGAVTVCVLSYVITGQFADTSVLNLETFGLSIEMLRLSPLTVLVLVISLLLGYLQVSLIGGLLGTGCSTMEDVEPANLTVILLVLAGYLTATVTVGFGDNAALACVVSLVPPASMFCAPARYMIGDIGIGTVVISWMIQIVVILLLAYVCARIYRALMMYRGSRMKLGAWIGMFRQNRRKEEDYR